MAGPAGTLVGRLLTKIVPDTSTFAAELKTKLEAMNLEVEVDVVPRISQAALRLAKAQLDAAFGPQIVPVVPAPGGAAGGPNAPNAAPAISAMRQNARDLNALRRAVDGINDLDLDEFESQLRRQADIIDEASERTGGLNRNLKITNTQLDKAGKDRKGGIFAFKKESEFGSIRALDPTRLLVLFGLLTSPAIVAAIAALAGATGGLAAGLTGAAGGAGVLALGFVGLIARFNEANEVSPKLAEAVERIRDAYSAFLDSIADDGFDTLAQGANILADLLPRLVPIFEAFNDVVQGALDGLAGFLAGGEGQRMLDFFETIGAQSFDLLLESLGNLLRFFGRLFEGLGPFAIEILEGLADATERWADSVDGIGDSPKFQAFLQFVRDTGPLVVDVFRSLWDALSAIAVALSPFAGPVLDGLISFFDTIANTDPAILQAVVAGVAATLAAFLSISAVLAIIALANPVVAITAAIAGLSVALAVFVNGHPEVQSALKELLDSFDEMTGIGDAVESVKDGIEEFVSLVSTALQDFAPTAEKILEDFTQLWEDLAPSVQEATGAIGEAVESLMVFLGTAFSQGLAAITVLWDAFGPSIMAILEPALDLIIGAIENVFGILEGIFDLGTALLTGDWEGAWDAILSIIENQGELITGIVQGLFDTIVEIFTAIGDQVKVLVEGDWGALKDILTEKNAEATEAIEESTAAWFETVKQRNAEISADVNASWSANLETIRTKNREATENINASASSWFEGVKAGNARISADVNSSWSANLESIRAKNREATANINASFSSMFETVRGKNAEISANVNTKFSEAVGYIRTAGGNAVAAVGGWMSDLGSAVSGGIETVLGYFRGLPGQITSALSGISLSSIGSSIIGTLVSGIQSRIGEVRSTLQSLTSSIPDWKGPASRDRVLLREPADLIMDGFINQVEKRFGDVKDAFGRVPIDITGGAMLAGMAGAAGASGPTVQVVADPRSDRGFVEDVASAAQRGTMRAMNLRYRRV